MSPYGRQNTKSATANATNATATATIAAPDANNRWRIDKVSASLSAAPAAGGATLQVKSGSTVLWQVDLTAAGPFSEDFAEVGGLQADPGAAVSVVLAAAGVGGVVGRANIFADLED